MIVNNWYVTCDMYCVIVNSIWPRVFFAFFWIISVLIMLNIVVSFVLEVYNSVTGDVYEEFKK
jgi:hypothetical protein